MNNLKISVVFFYIWEVGLKKIFLLFLLLTSKFVFAQPFTFYHFTTREGLPNNFIQSICTDNNGFLWVGTTEGICKYNGSNFEKLKVKNKQEEVLNSASFPRIVKLNNDLLLLNHNNGSLTINSKTQQTSFPKDSTIAFGQYLTNTEPCDWHFFNRGKKIVACNSNLNIKYTFKTEISSSRANIVQISKKIFWAFQFLTDNENVIVEINVENGTSKKINLYHPKLKRLIKNASTVFKKGNKVFLCEFEHGFYEIDINTLKVKDISNAFIKNKINFFYLNTLHLTDSTVVLVGNNYKILFNTNTYAMSNFLYNDINNSPCGSILKDEIGNIWLGCQDGLYKISKTAQQVKSLSVKDITGKNDVQEFMDLYKSGDELFINSYSGTYNYNFNTQLSKKLFTETFWRIQPIDNELFFSGHLKHILKFNPKTKSSIPFLENITDTAFSPKGKSTLILFLHQDKFKNYWFSLNQGYGLYKYNPTTKQTYAFNKIKTGNNINKLYFNNCLEDNEGGLWFFMVHSSNLFYIAPNSLTLTEINLNQSKGGIVSAFYYQHQIYFAIKGGGIGIYNIAKNKTSFLDKTDGLPSLLGSDIFVINNKLIYTSWSGIYIKDLKSNKHKVFTKNSGLPGDNFNTFHFFDTSNGQLYLPEYQNIIYFNLDSLFNSTNYSTKIIVENYTVHDSIYYPSGKKLSFEHFQNNITYNYSLIDWENFDKVKLYFKLKGLENKWHIATNKNSITFNNLSPGEYSLELYTVNANGNTSEITSFPTIIIKQAFYKTWWFILFCILLFGALIFFAIRYYYITQLAKQKAILEKQKAVEQERTRIATDMHDDFGANLSRIKFLSEKLKHSDKENIDVELNKISAFSDDMSEKMNEIVWSLNSKFDSLEDLISYTRAYVAETLVIYNIKFNLIENINSNIVLPSETRRNLFLSIKEAIHNTIKHAQASAIELKFESNNNSISITITDNGIGFDKNNIRKFANGLLNMRKRMEQSNGKIEIENNNGTIINFFIKLS